MRWIAGRGHNISRKSVKLVVYRFYCMALYHFPTLRHVIIQCLNAGVQSMLNPKAH